MFCRPLFAVMKSVGKYCGGIYFWQYASSLFYVFLWYSDQLQLAAASIKIAVWNHGKLLVRSGSWDPVVLKVCYCYPEKHVQYSIAKVLLIRCFHYILDVPC